MLTIPIYPAYKPEASIVQAVRLAIASRKANNHLARAVLAARSVA